MRFFFCYEYKYYDFEKLLCSIPAGTTFDDVLGDYDFKLTSFILALSQRN